MVFAAITFAIVATSAFRGLRVGLDFSGAAPRANKTCYGCDKQTIPQRLVSAYVLHKLRSFGNIQEPGGCGQGANS